MPKWREVAISSVVLAAPAFPAFADETPALPEVDSTVESVIGAVKVAGDAVKTGISLAGDAFEVAKQGYEVASPYIEKGVTLATPYVKQAIEAATPYVKSALPSIAAAEKAVEESIKSSTPAELDTAINTVVATGKTLTPYATQAIDTISTYDSSTLGEIALGAVAFTYLAPAFAGIIADSTRGYAGDVTSANVIDTLTGDSVLVDIRTASEKDSSGLPDLASNNKLVEVEFAVTEDKRLRGSLRDAYAVETTITAIQIAALKRVNKGTKIVLLSRDGGAARNVAKELNRLGFGKVFVISGGFDGGNGWVRSKLPIKPTSFSFSAPAPSFGTAFTSKKALPAPK